MHFPGARRSLRGSHFSCGHRDLGRRGCPMTEVPLTPIEEVKLLVDLLDRLGITPLRLHVDTRMARAKADLSLACRSDFERFVEAAGVLSVERPARVSGQREWFAEVGSPGWEVLVQ